MIYYVDGNFSSRKGIEIGSVTLHPSGLPHGPQPGLAERAIGMLETHELAVMCDTFHPLKLTPFAQELDDGRYAYSWYENADAPADADEDMTGAGVTRTSRPFASTADVAEKQLHARGAGRWRLRLHGGGRPERRRDRRRGQRALRRRARTPTHAREWLDVLASVTDSPSSWLVLTHYHAVRTLGASAFDARLGRRPREHSPVDPRTWPGGLGVGATALPPPVPGRRVDSRPDVPGRLFVDDTRAASRRARGAPPPPRRRAHHRRPGGLAAGGARPLRRRPRRGAGRARTWATRASRSGRRDAEPAGGARTGRARPRPRPGASRRRGGRGDGGDAGRTSTIAVGAPSRRPARREPLRGVLRGGPGGAGAALRRLGDLRALPPVQRQARVRRGERAGAAGLDRRAGRRGVGAAPARSDRRRRARRAGHGARAGAERRALARARGEAARGSTKARRPWSSPAHAFEILTRVGCPECLERAVVLERARTFYRGRELFAVEFPPPQPGRDTALRQPPAVVRRARAAPPRRRGALVECAGVHASRGWSRTPTA